jgi:glycosyltransferase involved in cell wall biosynthesis
MARPLRVLYVFTARKKALLTSVRRGTSPDTLLFGLNHLDRHGIDASFFEPDYGAIGRALSSQVGRLGPDVLQLRTLAHFSSYDVVFLTGGWPLLLAAQALNRRKRPKLIWLNMTLTNLLRRRGPLVPLIATAIKRADRVICVARAQQHFLSSRLGLSDERLPVVLSGTDTSFFDPAKLATASRVNGHDGPRVVLSAGRDAARDYRTLLTAAQGEPFQLRLVCSPSNLEGLTLPPNTQVRYDIPPSALRDEYVTSDVISIPTQGDASTSGSDCSGTLVLLDALAMGRPCVISDRSSVHDYVTAGVHAVVVPPGEPSPLRSNLTRLCDDAAAAGTIARAGQAVVRERLSTAHFAAQVADVVRDVVEHR